MRAEALRDSKQQSCQGEALRNHQKNCPPGPERKGRADQTKRGCI